MSSLSTTDLDRYAKKILRFYFPSVNVQAQPMNPKTVAFAFFLHEKSIAASTGIQFIEEVWKGTLIPGRIRTLNELLGLLKDATKGAAEAYLAGEVKIIVKNSIRRSWRSAVEIYFTIGDPHPWDTIKRSDLN